MSLTTGIVPLKRPELTTVVTTAPMPPTSATLTSPWSWRNARQALITTRAPSGRFVVPLIPMWVPVKEALIVIWYTAGRWRVDFADDDDELPHPDTAMAATVRNTTAIRKPGPPEASIQPRVHFTAGGAGERGARAVVARPLLLSAEAVAQTKAVVDFLCVCDR